MNELSQVIYVFGRGPLTFGINRALDAGWTHKGKPHHWIGVTSLCCPPAYGFGVITGKWLWAVYWDRRAYRHA